MADVNVGFDTQGALHPILGHHIDERALGEIDIDLVLLECEEQTATEISEVFIVTVSEASKASSVFNAESDGDCVIDGQLSADVYRSQAE